MKTLAAFPLLVTFALAEQFSFSVDNRIANGIVAHPNQFPYQVGLLIVKKMEPYDFEATSWCGGSLISDEVVLTAAHCLDKALRAGVFLGAHDITKPDEPGRMIIKIEPKHMVVNEDYDRVTAENDIALIRLPVKVPLSATLQTISMPRFSSRGKNYEGLGGVISGWGKMGDTGQQSPVLRYANRKIMKDRLCKFYFYGFASSQICVDGGDLTSACPGDSGGPLVITESNGEKTLIGLTSYGRIEGCQKGFPSVYTKIANFLGWIAANSNVNIRA
uniref:Venom polypeptide n=1 Tax=Dolopus genitalis TaxID=2488630 RepID=A0A3G5BIF9_DOLGE|nr:venom polypeptide [Dolopus genitalis]